jgi:hypothetical protein
MRRMGQELELSAALFRCKAYTEVQKTVLSLGGSIRDG